jgi:hypothetical protein
LLVLPPKKASRIGGDAMERDRYCERPSVDPQLVLEWHDDKQFE